ASPATGSKALDVRSEDGDGGVFAGDDIGQGDIDLHRFTVSLSHNRHPPAFCLRDEVIPGPVHHQAEPGDRAPDQLWPPCAPVVDRDAAALECSWPKVVDHNVRGLQKALEHGPVRRSVQVCSKPELVPVDAKIVSASALPVERRAPSSAFVAGSGSLDLNDIGSEVAKEHRAKRSGKHPT